MNVRKNTILTDRSLQELETHGTEGFPYKYYYEEMKQFDQMKIPSHWHKEFEIVYIQEGIVRFHVNQDMFELCEGEAIFINGGVIHGMESVEGGIIPNILFSGSLIASERSQIYSKYISPFLEEGITYIKICKNMEWGKTIIQHLLAVFERSVLLTIGYELEIHILLCQVWKQLYEHRKEGNAPMNTAMQSRSQIRLRIMMEYIEKNYAHRIGLEDIAMSANVSKSEVLRCFKGGTNVTPLQYVLQCRLLKARELLLLTNDPITHISLSVGFEHCSYFDRCFKKKYGMTPKQFRENEEP